MHFIGVSRIEDNWCVFGFSEGYFTLEKDFNKALKEAYDKFSSEDNICNITVITLTCDTDLSALLNLLGDSETFIDCVKQLAKHCEWNLYDEDHAYLVSENINEEIRLGEFIIASTKADALDEFTDGYLYRREGEAHKVTPQSLVKKLSEVTFYNTYSILAEALDYLQLKEGV